MTPNAWLDACASLLAPEHCVACRRPLPPRERAGWSAWLCQRCQRRLESVGDACLRCAGPLAQGPCPCAAPDELDRTTALVRYRGTGRRLLHRLKYGGLEALAPELGRRLAARLSADGTAPLDLLVVPIPLHPWRHLRRGFNQAHALAAVVADELERPLLSALRRRRRTRPLYTVTRGRRPAALEHAFALRRGVELAGRPVLLVDDIRTSGATLRAAATCLRAAGAARVDAAVVAR